MSLDMGDVYNQGFLGPKIYSILTGSLVGKCFFTSKQSHTHQIMQTNSQSILLNTAKERMKSYTSNYAGKFTIYFAEHSRIQNLISYLKNKFKRTNKNKIK